MRNSLYLTTFLVPAIGIMSGLSASILITIFLIAYLINYKKEINFLYFEKKASKYKLELIFFGWCFLSCFWSENILLSLMLFLQVFIIVALGLILKDFHKDKRILLENPLILGFIVAIILFFIEYSSNGFLTSNFRKLFNSSNKIFCLYMLDRGCALLSVISWVIIGYLIKKRKYFLCTIFCITILYTLFMSDSLSAFLAFTVAIIIALVAKLLSSARLLKFISLLIIAGAIAMPILSYNISPKEVSDQYNFLPFSAKHRLFIWNFVAHKITDKYLIGHGIGASRYFITEEGNSIYYEGQKLSAIPLHPHNNFIQILFETGIIGFILSLLILNKYLKNITNSEDVNYKITSYACLVNYLVIGMISFSVWQIWWVATGIFATILMSNIVKNP